MRLDILKTLGAAFIVGVIGWGFSAQGDISALKKQEKNNTRLLQDISDKLEMMDGRLERIGVIETEIKHLTQDIQEIKERLK